MKTSELYHYGVPGMKWGVRRYQPYSTGSGVRKRNGYRNRPAINKKAVAIGVVAAGSILGAAIGYKTMKDIRVTNESMDVVQSLLNASTKQAKNLQKIDGLDTSNFHRNTKNDLKFAMDYTKYKRKRNRNPIVKAATKRKYSKLINSNKVANRELDKLYKHYLNDTSIGYLY